MASGDRHRDIGALAQDQDVGPEEALGALKRVMASELFRPSRRSTAFLAFVVTETVAGRGDRLKERTVARYALERGPEFDPRTDAIVRVQAGRVRDSLQRYYETEGRDDEIGISLAPGSYAPAFVRRSTLPVVVPTQDAAPDAEEPLVTVVRFRELDPGAGPFSAAGVSESLVDELARFPGLRVRGPIDATLDGVEPDAFAGVGARVGANYVLHGSIRGGAAEVRVTVRLTDVIRHRVVWSQAFDRSGEDFSGFLGEDALVHRVVDAIADHGGVLHRETVLEGRTARPGSVFRATTLFYEFAESSRPDSRTAAMEALTAALAAEPDHPDLLGMLSACHAVGALLGLAPDPGPALAEAERLARQALALDSACPRALVTLALVSLARGNPEDASRFAGQAAAVWPRRPSTLFSAGIVTAVAGDWAAGIGLLRELASANPSQSGRLHLYLALDALLSGDDPLALVEANLIPAGSPWGPLLRGLAHAGLGYDSDAARELAEAESTMPGFVSARGFAAPHFWDIAPAARTMLQARADALNFER